MNHLLQTRCEDWPLGVEVAEMAAFAARMHRIHRMHAFMEAGASSAASIALRAELSERASKFSCHAIQQLCASACMILRYDIVIYCISELYTSYVGYTLPAQRSVTLCWARAGRPASTYT